MIEVFNRKPIKQPWLLGALIIAQSICAVFFALDAMQDYQDSGLQIFTPKHLIVEAVAATVLALTVVVEIQFLSQILKRQAYLSQNLSMASTAMHDVILSLFDDWKLTDSERDVAMLTIKGCSITEIAEVRGSAEGTVKAQLNSIYRKTGTKSRAELLSLLIDPLMSSPLIHSEKNINNKTNW